MKPVHVVEEAVVGGAPEQVYAVLADYREHHPRILPPAFTRLTGGVGAGTVISAEVRLGGRIRGFRARVEEPEPGRVLAETDPESGATTTFTVEPTDGGSRVRIETLFMPAKGMAGLLERWAAPVLLRRLYRQELSRLDAYVRTRARATIPSGTLV